MRRFIFISFLIFFIFFPCTVFGIDTQNTTVTLTIPSLGKLKIVNPNQIIDLSIGGEDAYDQGFALGAANFPTLTTSANNGWALTAKVSSNWTMVGSYQKSVSDLQLKINSSTGNQTGFTDFTSLSFTDQQIASSPNGAKKQDYFGQYKILLDWEKDIPGTYAIVITFTLTVQP